MDSGTSRSSEVRAFNEIQKHDRMSTVTPPRMRPKNVPDIDMKTVLSGSKKKENKK